MIRVVVQEAPIDLAAEFALAEAEDAGAVATFTGLVCLWGAAALTAITGWDYLRVGLKHMDS